jgi:hypothetical protein
MGDHSGTRVISQLMNREYLQQFMQVDQEEQTNLVLAALDAAAQLDAIQFKETLEHLTQSDPNMKVRSKAMETLKKSHDRSTETAF